MASKRRTEDQDSAAGDGKPLAIVGIAASAAALPALERLFAHLPKTTGLAFVVAIRSRDALEAGRVAASLQKSSGRPTRVARNGDRLRPDHVLIGDSDAILSFDDGAIKVSPPQQGPGERGVIDTMLVSLAEHQEHSAIAVILAGLGADGVLGVAAIKEAGGLALAEAPADGAVDAPWEAITPAGMVDFLLPVERLPEQILAYAHYLTQLRQSSEMDRLKDEAGDQLPRVAAILRNRTGHDFHGYKPNTFLRRIQRRMHVVQADSLDSYVERLRDDAGEVDSLFQDLLIGVTQFFRDKPEFDLLEREIIPRIFEGKGPGDPVRVWVLGCATGEEAYSLAILLREHMAGLDVPPNVQIFATDIDGRALALARAGRYAEHIAKDMSAERLARWFVREGNTFCVHKDLREMCVFSAHNVIKDAPVSRIDLISCRNLLIYLNSDLQNRIIPLFHFALKPGGCLFLGPSENVTRHAKLFQPVDRKHRIFRRQETVTRVAPAFPLSARAVVPGAPGEPAPGRPRNTVGNLARQVERIAERHAPAYVIVDADHEVLHFSGRTGRYLEPAPGAANLNLLSLVHRDLRLDLRGALHRVQEDGAPVKLERLVFTVDGESRAVNLIVEPVGAPDGGSHLVVLFQDVGPAEGERGLAPEAHLRDEHVLRLEADLRLTKERLQATIEELESTNEELKSSNEEYQSINEEMQSANEELETSKEELQSVNEELQTVNSELAHRVGELGKANSDLKNLLESTQIATVFLDKELRVRTFTPVTTELFHFLETDIGRPIAHITSRLDYPELQEDVKKVLRTLSAVQREVRNPDTGASYLARVLPYRSIDDFIGGAVLTFLDMTAATRAEEALRRSEAHNRLILESATDYAIITTDLDGVVTGWNPGARELLGWSEDEMLGRPVDMIFTADDREAHAPEEERRRAQAEGRAADERWHVRKDGQHFWGAGMMTPMRDRQLSGFLKILRDCTAQRMAEDRQKLLLSELQHRVRNILAVVRSLAARTASSSETLEDFASHFDGRLTTLSRTQNVFARTGDVTVDLEEMVREELLALAPGEEEQVEIAGPPVQLREQAAETFALALHELATNAVKYGALATPNGKVSIQWRLLNTKGGQRLALEWRETGVTALDLNPGRSGFGRELIERGLPYELGAATSLAFEPGGVRALIELPINEETAAAASLGKRRLKP